MFDLMHILQGTGMNEFIEGDGFWISYNPSTSEGAETALCKTGKDGTNFYILLGDYRKQYRKEVKNGYMNCKKLFTRLAKEGAEKSPWSN